MLLFCGYYVPSIFTNWIIVKFVKCSGGLTGILICFVLFIGGQNLFVFGLEGKIDQNQKLIMMIGRGIIGLSSRTILLIIDSILALFCHDNLGYIYHKFELAKAFGGCLAILLPYYTVPTYLTLNVLFKISILACGLPLVLIIFLICYKKIIWRHIPLVPGSHDVYLSKCT
eukprot:UN07955